MTVADITLAVFTLFNSARFLAYIPQIIKATKDQSGAEAISFGTWALFLASHLSAMAYAIVNQADWTMASLFLSNAVGCGVIILIAGFKRSRHRRRVAAAATDDDRRAEPFRMLAAVKTFNPLTLGNPNQTARRDLRMTRECTLVEEDRTRSDLAELGLKLGLIVMVLVLGGVALAQTAAPAAMALTPGEMKWQSQGGLAAPGMEQINLVGDPVKFPSGMKALAVGQGANFWRSPDGTAWSSSGFGGAVFLTDDGGQNWKRIAIQSGSASDLRSIVFTSTLTGIAVGAGRRPR